MIKYPFNEYRRGWQRTFVNPGSGQALDRSSLTPNCVFSKESNNLKDLTGYAHNLYHKLQGERQWMIIKLKPTPKCDFLSPASTDHGICQSFNSVPIDDILNESAFTKAFKMAYKKEINYKWKIN